MFSSGSITIRLAARAGYGPPKRYRRADCGVFVPAVHTLLSLPKGLQSEDIAGVSGHDHTTDGDFINNCINPLLFQKVNDL